MASKQVKGVHPFMDAFFVHRRYAGMYDDLECQDITVNGKKYLEIYRRSTFVAPKAANSERVVPVRPVRIVVEEDGKASFQVLFRVFQESSTTEEFCELLKQLSAVGGFRLCSGLDERDVSQSRASTVVHFIHPFERMEARGCLLWFSPKYRRKPLVNNLMSRCPRCSVWTSHTKYQKKRSREELEEDGNNPTDAIVELQSQIVEQSNVEDAEDVKPITEEQDTTTVESIETENETETETIHTVPLTSVYRRQDSMTTSNVTVSIQSVREVSLSPTEDRQDSSKRQKVIQIQLVEDSVPQHVIEENSEIVSSNGSLPTIGWTIASDITSMINWNSNRTRITMESQEDDSSQIE